MNKNIASWLHATLIAVLSAGSTALTAQMQPDVLPYATPGVSLGIGIAAGVVSRLLGYLIARLPAAAPLLLLGVLASLPACSPAPANAEALPSSAVVTRMRFSAAGDTVYFSVRWTAAPVTDGRGPVDTYRIIGTRTTPTPATTVTVSAPAGATTATVAIPTGGLAVGASATGTLCVYSVRRLLVSTTGACVTPWTVTFADQPPPAPTQAQLDSLRLSALDVQPKGLQLAAGATAQFCAFVRLASGQVGMRTVDRPACDTMYTRLYAGAVRSLAPKQQAVVDSVCLVWQTTAGGISVAGCDQQAVPA